MGVREKKIGKAFDRMSLIVLAVIIFIVGLYSVDLMFHLEWGYNSKDLELGLFVLVFAIALRIVGLRLISYVDRTK
jgi:hypothetical protein